MNSSISSSSALRDEAHRAPRSGADIDLSALGGGEDAASGRRGGRGARLFLAAMAMGLIACAATASLAPESWIHTAPEYGMAEAFEDHIQAACSEQARPDLLIIGDSRAVAGVSAETIAAAGLSVEKFALGGSGLFTGWAVLDRLTDCGVRPRQVLMAYGSVHVLDTGAMMERTTNYDLLKGPRRAHAYAEASAWESSQVRALAYRAISFLGTEASLVDLVLLQPALRNVLEKPPAALENYLHNERERDSFLRSRGDRFYGQANGTSDLPDEKQYGPGQSPPRINHEASAAIARLGQTYGFEVLFYLLPVSQTAMTRLPAELFETVATFAGELQSLGVRPLNTAWALPDADFGDPSHVNAAGRRKVTDDLLARLGALQTTLGSRTGETHETEALFAQKGEKTGQ